MKKFIVISLALMWAAVSMQVFAQTPPPIPAAAHPDVKNIARITPPLATLVKQFKHDPSAEAEIISRKTEITVDENYFSHSVSYVAVYINSDEAVRDYSQISISFNSFYEDITLEFANVRTPEGDMDSIKPDATQIQSPSDENFYQDRKDLLFSLPNVRKGSVIEFQYRYTDTKKIVPHQWFDSFSMNWWEGRAAGQGSRSDAIANTELNIIAPKQLVLFNNDLSNVGISYTRQEKNNQQILTWKGKNLPKIVLQDSMPRDERRSMQLRSSTMRSWQEIATWANQLSAPHVVTDTNLEKLINDISKKSITPDEKVKAVYQTLQEKIRYVFAHVGRGGYEPHNAFEVLTNGYGDCKDQTILAVTMLRKLGIKADPALVITRSRGIPEMKITSVSFDHMIVHIPAQAGLDEIWMDTSGDKGLFPGFSIGLEGQPALIVNDATQNIVIIPALTSDMHFAHLDLTFDKFEGKNTEANFTLKLGGEFEQRLRGMWQYSRERDKSFRELVGHIYSSAEVASITANNADNLWQSFSLNGQYKFTNVWSGNKEPLTYGFNITQLINLFTDFRDIHKPKDRIQDYEIDPGYTISSHIIFSRPTVNHVVNLISQGQNFDNTFFSLEQKGHEENGNYVVDIRLVVKATRVSPQEYAHFYEQIHQLLDANEWTIVFRFDKSAADLAALKATAAKTGKAENFIALAKMQIKNGTYDKALETANQAVKTEPKNAAAYYVLGLAQGYNNLLYESEKSFAKAEELGFSL
jgi:tetratricopeptide (TPR) repeat protein